MSNSEDMYDVRNVAFIDHNQSPEFTYRSVTLLTEFS